MRTYILKRLLLAIPTLAGASLIVFVIVRLIPGDAVLLMMAESPWVDKTQIGALRQYFGLDLPYHLQYLRWMRDVLRGDLGLSYWANTPVLDEILRRLPVTVELSLISIFIAAAMGLPIGVLSAVRQDSRLDYVVRILSIGGLSIPNFWLGILVIVLPSIFWQWSPRMDYVTIAENPLRNLYQFIWPGMVLGVYLAASIMRITRASMLEVLRQDYVRTAWSKGLPPLPVIARHAVKNAMIPVITIAGVQFGFLLGGTVIIERLFSLPGIGSLVLDAISQRDYPLLQGTILFISFFYIMVNLAVDLSYGLFDPKIRY